MLNSGLAWTLHWNPMKSTAAATVHTAHIRVNRLFLPTAMPISMNSRMTIPITDAFPSTSTQIYFFPSTWEVIPRNEP